MARILCTCFIRVLVVSPSLAQDGVVTPVMHPGTTSAGSVAVYSESGTSGEFGTWTVTYTVGEKSTGKGGGIRVQMPDAWHGGPRNSANRLQVSVPTADHFVSSRCSRRDVHVQTVVEYEPNCIYYARLGQKNIVRNRIVMAWSSPIWTRAPEYAG